jgi:hypothetical protein
MFVFRDPVERLQVAQPALALLHVGLQHVALAALLAVARGAFGQLRLDELGPTVAVEELLAEQSRSSNSAPTVSVPQRNRISSRLVRIVMSCRPSAGIPSPCATGMADLHVKVPQHVERGFDDVLDARGSSSTTSRTAGRHRKRAPSRRVHNRRPPSPPWRRQRPRAPRNRSARSAPRWPRARHADVPRRPPRWRRSPMHGPRSRPRRPRGGSLGHPHRHPPHAPARAARPAGRARRPTGMPAGRPQLRRRRRYGRG